jgi:hypothetical protein
LLAAALPDCDLPAPATLLPLLADTEGARQALEGQALRSAFAIGVGVASGSILVATYMRYGQPTLEPVTGALSERLSTLLTDAGRTHSSRRRHKRRLSP